MSEPYQAPSTPSPPTGLVLLILTQHPHSFVQNNHLIPLPRRSPHLLRRPSTNYLHLIIPVTSHNTKTGLSFSLDVLMIFLFHTLAVVTQNFDDISYSHAHHLSTQLLRVHLIDAFRPRFWFGRWRWRARNDTERLQSSGGAVVEREGRKGCVLGRLDAAVRDCIESFWGRETVRNKLEFFT